jgi:phage shock protein C
MPTTRLTRSRSDRLVAGVAGGLAAYLGVDPILVRIGFVALVFFTNLAGVLAYVALWLLLPNEDSSAPDTRTQVRENVAEMQRTADDMAERVRGMFSR